MFTLIFVAECREGLFYRARRGLVNGDSNALPIHQSPFTQSCYFLNSGKNTLTPCLSILMFKSVTAGGTPTSGLITVL